MYLRMCVCAYPCVHMYVHTNKQANKPHMFMIVSSFPLSADAAAWCCFSLSQIYLRAFSLLHVTPDTTRKWFTINHFFSLKLPLLIDSQYWSGRTIENNLTFFVIIHIHITAQVVCSADHGLVDKERKIYIESGTSGWDPILFSVHIHICTRK